ncbi:hypothetical protein JHK87_029057 [Glycine soja]|nr:hypothetical protein JHK87_029057 [Glycine soja]
MCLTRFMFFGLDNKVPEFQTQDIGYEGVKEFHFEKLLHHGQNVKSGRRHSSQGGPGMITTVIQEKIMEKAILEGYPTSNIYAG